MNTKDKGDISEAKVQARYMELGYTVLEPRGDNERYDIVVQPPESDEFARVQIKTGRSKNGGDKLEFDTKSSNPHSSDWDGEYSSQNVDVFAVYFPDKDDYFEVPIEECGAHAKTLSCVGTDRPELEGRLNMTEDYKLT